MPRTSALFRRLLVCLTFVLAAATLRADDAAAAPTQLPTFFVPGDRIGATEIAVPRRDLRRPEPNLGADLLSVPGVAAQARAADAMEPSIRGLGFDRVGTTLNGLPLLNASPERTNSPVVIVGPTAVSAITVTKALPSVTQGPVTTGGAIALQTAEPTAAPTTALAVITGYDGARDGLTTQARGTVAADGWDASATAFRNDLHDYRAGDRTVAARFLDYGNSLGIGWHEEAQRVRADWVHRRLLRQETLALPLDGKNTDSDVLTFTHHWTAESAGALRATDLRAGYATTDPYITSEDRRAPSLTQAVAHARSLGAGLGSKWRTGETGIVALGGDYALQSRRAVRTTAAGTDFIWPNAWYEDAGAYAEWNAALARGWRIRLGGRADEVRSDARDADQPALGRPLRAQFATFNGPDAAVTARRDTVGAMNLLAEWSELPHLSGFVGAGLSAQPAPITERYRAFLNALGGDGRGGNAVELGNPALKPERKAAFEAGATWRDDRVELQATAYYYRITDFILRTPVGTTTPPLARMVVFGYRNLDADFGGAELGATAHLGAGWTLPVTFAVADGWKRHGGTGLPEIPPWDATAALRCAGTWRGMPWRLRARENAETASPAGAHLHRPPLPYAFEFGTRVVGAKANPAPADNPLFRNTGGFAVWHVRVGVTVAAHVKLELGAENLFDRVYSEYLTPPVAPFAPATGNLRPGDRVPAVGRSLWSSLTLTW